MTTPYLTCTNCGQKSSDTRRCKHCGQIFGRAPQPGNESGSKGRGVPFPALLALVAIAVAGLALWWPRPHAGPTAVVPETSITVPAQPPIDSTPAPQSSAEKAVPSSAPVDTPRSGGQPRAERSEPTPPQQQDTSKPLTTAPAPEPVVIDVERQRYALSGATVRSERNGAASILQLLRPGEIVAIDSLEDGWYRVRTDRATLGYVDQQYLDTVPPAQP